MSFGKSLDFSDCPTACDAVTSAKCTRDVHEHRDHVLTVFRYAVAVCASRDGAVS